MEVGIPAENIVLAELGDVIQFDDEGVTQGRPPRRSGRSSSTESTSGGVTDVVLRDRQHLSRDGVVIVSITLDRTTGAN